MEKRERKVQEEGERKEERKGERKERGGNPADQLCRPPRMNPDDDTGYHTKSQTDSFWSVILLAQPAELKTGEQKISEKQSESLLIQSGGYSDESMVKRVCDLRWV